MQLSLHCQAIPGWAPKWALDKGVTWIKVIDPPESNPFPGARVVGRTFMPDGDSNALVMQGALGARTWFNRWLPFYRSRSYVHAWEGPNEPPVDTKEQRVKLAEFSAEWNALMHRIGPRTVVMNLSVGQPDIGTAMDLKPGIDGADYLGLHEYSAPQMSSGESWYCLRYRRMVKELGGTTPLILITETGIDGGVLQQADKGWHTYANADQYLAQLDWYARQLAQDNVAAAFIFTAGVMSRWWDFEIDESLANRLTVHYPSAVQPIPAPPAALPIVMPALPPLYLPFTGNYRITSSYASHKSRTPPSTAPGIDYALPISTLVRAAGGGWVTKVNYNDVAGLFVTIRHNPRLFTSYRHLSSVIVGVGQKVTAKQLIGTSGSSGHSTGPHLHFDVYRRGVYVDPAPLLRPNP